MVKSAAFAAAESFFCTLWSLIKAKAIDSAVSFTEWTIYIHVHHTRTEPKLASNIANYVALITHFGPDPIH